MQTRLIFFVFLFPSSPSFFFFTVHGGVFQDPCQYTGHQWCSVLLPGPLFALGLPPRSEQPPFVWDNRGGKKAKMTDGRGGGRTDVEFW